LTQEEATALFERVHDTLSPLLHGGMISLIYYQSPGLSGHHTWSIFIKTLDGDKSYPLTKEADWHYYKLNHGLHESMDDTDENTEPYLDV
jgi:hypothetical protein